MRTSSDKTASRQEWTARGCPHWGVTWAEDSAVRTAVVTIKKGMPPSRTPFPSHSRSTARSYSRIDPIINGQDEVLFQDERLVVSVAHPFAYSCRVVMKDRLNMIVTAARHEHPKGNHIDIGVSKLNVTDTVHGALVGQTLAAARAAVLRAAASEIGSSPKFDEADIEGKDLDYMTSSLLSSDFVFNRFGLSTSDTAKTDVITRKLLSDAAAGSNPTAVVGKFSCKNKPFGGLTCSN